MSRSWRDYAARAPRDNSDNSDERALAEPEEAAFVPIVPFFTVLPAFIREGLEKLGEAPAPRLLRPEVWPGVVADAQRLATEGWALQALGLDWSALDLFGAVTDPSGDPGGDGLAAKLEGRRVLAICASFATVADADGGRSYLYRRTDPDARLLWDMGGGG
jgi:hypothetical protein